MWDGTKGIDMIQAESPKIQRNFDQEEGSYSDGNLR